MTTISLHIHQRPTHAQERPQKKNKLRYASTLSSVDCQGGMMTTVMRIKKAAYPSTCSVWGMSCRIQHIHNYRVSLRFTNPHTTREHRMTGFSGAHCSLGLTQENHLCAKIPFQAFRTICRAAKSFLGGPGVAKVTLRGCTAVREAVRSLEATEGECKGVSAPSASDRGVSSLRMGGSL